MSLKGDAPRTVAEAMLALVDPAGAQLSGDRELFAVTIAGMTVTFGDDRPHSFERLASAIEARIAYERATAMVAAAGETGVPLWLVAGSDVLGKWLAWSRTGNALAKALTLTDRVDAAPVVGNLARRARRDLGQMSAKIRVRSGQAVAERIELSHRFPAIAVLGDQALVRIARHHLPSTLLQGLGKELACSDRWRASEIIGHPFFGAHDFMVARVDNDGEDIVVELETACEPLAPMPKAAWGTAQRGADPTLRWRATKREVAELYGLAVRGEHALQGRI